MKNKLIFFFTMVFTSILIVAPARTQDSSSRRGGGRMWIGAEMLMVKFQTTARALKDALPAPLEPGADPVGMVFVAHYPKTTFGSVYHEGAVFLWAKYGDFEGWHCLAMPVDDQRAMWLGRRIGYNKKMTEISLDRDGKKMTARVQHQGKELFVIRAILEKDGEAPDVLTGGPHLNFIPLAKTGSGPPLGSPSTLVSFISASDVHRAETGTAELVFHKSDTYPLAELPVEKILNVTYVEHDFGGGLGSSSDGVRVPALKKN